MPTKIVYTGEDGKPVEVPADKVDWSQLDLSDHAEDFPIDRLPQAWQTNIRKLRRENASARAASKEKPAGKDDKSEEKPSESSELATLRTELARERIMRKFKLSDDEAELLRGDSPEALTESAETLIRVLGARKGADKEDGKEDKPGDKSGEEGKPPAGSGTPKPRLREAGTDTDTEAFDPDAIAGRIAASRGGI